MINFILYDDDTEFLGVVRGIINKQFFSSNKEYRIHNYDSYNKELKDMINSNTENKIYILDIEVKGISGIELAKIIRKKDWSSTIIILTSHYELELLSYKSKILLLDYISKFDIYEEKLKKTIMLAMKNLEKRESISIKEANTIYRILFENIIYIYYDSFKRKSIIVTKDKSYMTLVPLNKIYASLSSNFVYSHRACIINSNYIESIDTKNMIISLMGNIKIDLFSKGHIKEIKGCFQ